MEPLAIWKPAMNCLGDRVACRIARVVRITRIVRIAAFALYFATGAAATGRTVTLEEATRLALVHDPAAVAAEAVVSRAQADLLQARGAWLPSLSLGSAYVNSSSQRLDTVTGRVASENYTAQALANLEIFGGGRRLAEVRAASAEQAAAVALFRARRFATILRTTEVFYDAAAADDLEDLARSRLERAVQQLAFARTRYEVGTATTSDLLRAELEVGNAELASLEAQSAMRRTSLELGRQVGTSDAVYPVAAALPVRAPDLEPADVLARRAALSSPQVLASEATLRSARASRLAGYSGYLPSVGLSGGYDWYSTDFPPDRRSWSYRLSASLPLFDRFRREALLQRAAATQRLAEAEARDAGIEVLVDVDTSVQDIELAERRVEIADRSVELAREDLRVLEERYQIGVATILDLQTSQLLLTEAEISAVRARQALGMAVARLEAVLGERLVP